MFNKLAAIIRKDATIRFASRSELLFFLILPVVFTAILGGGVAFGAPGDDNRVRLPVADLDGSDLSAALVAQLALSDTVRAEVMDQAAAEQLLDARDVSAIITIPPGFGAALGSDAVLGDGTAKLSIASAPNSNAGLIVEQALREATAAVSRPLLVARASTRSLETIAPFASPAERAATFDRARGAAEEALGAAPRRVLFTTTGETDAYNQSAQSSAGQLITWVLIPLLGISGLFAYERVTGTLRRTIVTPTRKSTYLLGTISGQMLMALVQMAILVLFGILVMKVPWGQNPVALALILVTFALAAVCMGTMLGTLVKTESQASNVSIMLGMAMALLGGCWWPMELFPPAVQTAVKALPTTWAMQAMTDLTMRGQGLVGVAPESAVLVGFAVLFFIIGVWRFRFE